MARRYEMESESKLSFQWFGSGKRGEVEEAEGAKWGISYLIVVKPGSCGKRGDTVAASSCCHLSAMAEKRYAVFYSRIQTPCSLHS